MKAYRILFYMLVLVLCGCSGARATPTPMPTPTIDPNTRLVPLSELNLAPFLIWPGDLPAGMSGRQVSSGSLSDEYGEKLPKPDNEIYQEIEGDRETTGSVTVFLYKSSDDRATAYDLVLDGFPGAWKSPDSGVVFENKPLDAVGEEATIASMDGISRLVRIVFIRCNAVVYISMTETVRRFDRDRMTYGPIIDPNRTIDLLVAEAISYAERLDERLAQVVCR